ncbi:MAG: hypothetical protein KC468_09970, partial [Myxococcales bacterium]|nr:hypothetical protein [Myxococcales bacterium]
WGRARGGSPEARPVLLQRAALGFAVAAYAALAVDASARRPRAPDPFAILMKELDARGISRVMVARDAELDTREQLSTYFGAAARRLPRDARLSDAPADTQAIVSALAPPREYAAPSGVEIIRAPGAVAFVGDPARVTWGDEALAALLSGPGSSITLEAEDLRGGEHGVLVEAPGDGDRDGDAPGVARAVLPGGAAIERFPLTRSPKLAVPAGDYRARFRMRGRCDGRGRELAEVRVRVGGRAARSETVRCDGGEGASERREDVSIDFRVRAKDRHVQLAVAYIGGAVWHDAIVIERRAPGE